MFSDSTLHYDNTISSINKLVAIEPIVATVEKEVRHGVAIAKQKVSLLKSKVVFFCDTDERQDLEINPGDTVYLRGDVITMPWVKEVFEVNGKKFILAPLSSIVLVEQ